MSRAGIPWQLDSGLAAQLIGQQAGVARQGLNQQLAMTPEIMQQTFGQAIRDRAAAQAQIAQMRQQQGLQKQAQMHAIAMAVGKSIMESQRLNAERENADADRASRAEQGGLDRASREKIAATRADGNDSMAALTTLYNRALLKQEMGLPLSEEETAAVSLKAKGEEKKQAAAEQKQLATDAGRDAKDTHRKVESADAAARKLGQPSIDRSQGWRDYLNKWASDFPGATWESLNPAARASLNALGLDQAMINAAATGQLQKQTETTAANVRRETIGGKSKSPVDFMDRVPGDEPLPWSVAPGTGGGILPWQSQIQSPMLDGSGMAMFGRALDENLSWLFGQQLPEREDYGRFINPQFAPGVVPLPQPSGLIPNPGFMAEPPGQYQHIQPPPGYRSRLRMGMAPASQPIGY